jgi:peptidoglycan/LPS O-acetylase OafA/YrhL
VPALDGLRALAVFMVVAWHCWNVSGNVSDSAGGRLAAGLLPNGIYLLFLISGFVMYLPTAARGRFGNVRAYALRRVARIVPAYYLGLAILLVFWPAFVAPGTLEYPSAANILAHLTFLFQPLALIDDTTFAAGFVVNGPVWTLPVEAMFYLVLPLVALPFWRHPVWGLAVALGIAIGWRLATDQINQFPFWIAALAAGMAAAQAYVRLQHLQARERFRAVALCAQLLALAALIALAWIAGGQDLVGTREAYLASIRSIPISTLFPLVLGLLVVATAYAPRHASWLVTNPAARWAGDRSYGVYVIHALVIRYVILHFFKPDRTGGLAEFAKWFLVVGGISLVYGWASYRFVELPVRRWARRVAKGWQASPRAAAVAEAPRP